MNRVDAGLYGVGAFCLILAVALTLAGDLDAAIPLFVVAAVIGVLYALDLIQYLRTKRHHTTTTGRTGR